MGRQRKRPRDGGGGCGNEAAPRVVGILDVLLHGARGLRNISPLGPQDVYVKLLHGAAGGAAGPVALLTRTIRRGGSNPTFNQCLQVAVVGGEAEVRCEVWVSSHHRGSFEDRLLGAVAIPIPFPKPGLGGGSSRRLPRQDFNLDGGSAGCVRATLAYHARHTGPSTMPVAAVPARLAQHASLGAKLCSSSWPPGSEQATKRPTINARQPEQPMMPASLDGLEGSTRLPTDVLTDPSQAGSETTTCSNAVSCFESHRNGSGGETAARACLPAGSFESCCTATSASTASTPSLGTPATPPAEGHDYPASWLWQALSTSSASDEASTLEEEQADPLFSAALPPPAWVPAAAQNIIETSQCSWSHGPGMGPNDSSTPACVVDLAMASPEVLAHCRPLDGDSPGKGSGPSTTVAVTTSSRLCKLEGAASPPGGPTSKDKGSTDSSTDRLLDEDSSLHAVDDPLHGLESLPMPELWLDEDWDLDELLQSELVPYPSPAPPTPALCPQQAQTWTCSSPKPFTRFEDHLSPLYTHCDMFGMYSHTQLLQALELDALSYPSGVVQSVLH
eukprot:SM000034S12687  [mRNA]  locus=s34:270930:273281:+ [translate_table: standard]